MRGGKKWTTIFGGRSSVSHCAIVYETRPRTMPLKHGSKLYCQLLLDPHRYKLAENLAAGEGKKVTALLRDMVYTALEKAWAKVLGNYLKTKSGYLDNGLRFLTGSPIFFYKLSNTTNLSLTFDLINAAD